MDKGSYRGNQDLVVLACRASNTQREILFLQCRANENHYFSNIILESRIEGHPAIPTDFPYFDVLFNSN